MTDFPAHRTSCKVYYKPGLFDHSVERLENIQHEIRHLKTFDQYIHNFIDFIKQNVIKKVPNLHLLQISLNIFDSNNILHRLIVTVTNMLHDILKLKVRVGYEKSVFVIVTYEDKPLFVGGINFNGLT